MPFYKLQKQEAKMFQNMMRTPKSFEDALVRMAEDEAKQPWKIGDCVNLNYVEQPYGRLVAVVVGVEGDYLVCQYLNADNSLDHYNDPPMKTAAADATKLSDFGVEMRRDGDEYWCAQVSESTATYGDGKPRKWQESYQTKYRGRPLLMNLVFGHPF